MTATGITASPENRELSDLELEALAGMRETPKYKKMEGLFGRICRTDEGRRYKADFCDIVLTMDWYVFPGKLKRAVIQLEKAIACLEKIDEVIGGTALLSMNTPVGIHFRTTLDELTRLKEFWSRRIPKRPGRPRRKLAEDVSRQIAHLFEPITGAKATVITPYTGGPARSPFMEVLGAVFEIMGIDASPESQARAAIRAMEKSGAEQSD